MQPPIKIELLTKQFLPETIRLVNRIFFPVLNPLERVSLRLYAFKERNWFRFLARLLGIEEVRFWVAVSPEPCWVVGTTGLYSYTRDAAEAYWLGWLCVDPQWRGQGIGAELLEFSIVQARQAGKRYLRLYTSTDPNEAEAQVLYEKRGFRLIGQKQPWLWRFWNIQLLYRELEL